MKIVTLTLNPALDKSSSVERMIPEHKLRCTAMRLDAGGGGVNVSKGIKKLGGESTAVFPLGGNNGRKLLEILAESGIATAIVDVPGETRENISIAESSTNLQYRFTTPGLELSEEQAEHCLHIIKNLKPDYLIASGSLPPGLPENYYCKVAALAKKTGTRFILDTSGMGLLPASDEGVFLLKPNLRELSALSGVEKLEMNQVDDAAMGLIQKGICEVVVVSLGPQGCLLATREGFEHISAPIVKKKSTVGAGDSMVAGMVWALSQGQSYLEMARMGVACGTAATMNEGTELFHPKEVWRLYHWIERHGDRHRITDF